MMMAKRRGRPAAGLRPGEKVRDYVRLGIRVPRRVFDLLEAMAKHEDRPQWRVVADAISERAERILK
jgi:hypothetical protein